MQYNDIIMKGLRKPTKYFKVFCTPEEILTQYLPNKSLEP
jgi:hypothetical protein